MIETFLIHYKSSDEYTFLFTLEVQSFKMENLINNPSLQHLVENILSNLEVEDLINFGLVSQSCQQIVYDPMFWLRKFRGLSKENRQDCTKIIQSTNNSDYDKLIVSYLQWYFKKDAMVLVLPFFWFKKFRSLSEENQNDWIKVIRSEKNSEKEEAIITYLQWKLEQESVLDLPCYSRSDVQDDFRRKILDICKNEESTDEDVEIIKILAPLTDDLNFQDEQGYTPIHYAFEMIIWANGYVSDEFMEIVKVLAPLVDPTVPNDHGRTPIHHAADLGYTDIVKIWAPLVENPNVADEEGRTPIYEAAIWGFTEIVKLLAPLVDNPNVADVEGRTPIFMAADGGSTEIVKILAAMTDNPNVPDSRGRTPIFMAAAWGRTEIVKLLASLVDNPNVADEKGHTPIYVAAQFGRTEIVKFLALLTDNPDAPDKDGITPSSVAKNAEIRKILKSFNPSRKPSAGPSKKRAKNV